MRQCHPKKLHSAQSHTPGHVRQLMQKAIPGLLGYPATPKCSPKAHDAHRTAGRHGLLHLTAETSVSLQVAQSGCVRVSSITNIAAAERLWEEGPSAPAFNSAIASQPCTQNTLSFCSWKRAGLAPSLIGHQQMVSQRPGAFSFLAVLVGRSLPTEPPKATRFLAIRSIPDPCCRLFAATVARLQTQFSSSRNKPCSFQRPPSWRTCSSENDALSNL